MVSLLAVTVPKQVPSTLPALSVDALIVLGVSLVFLYGFIRGHAALIREAISIYVGLVLANNFGGPAHDYIKHAGSYPVTQTEVQLALPLIPVLILQFGRKHAHGHQHNMIATVLLAFATVLLAFATAMLLVSSVLGQLDDLTLSRTLDASQLASLIYHANLIWLAAVPVVVLVSAVLQRKSSKRSHH